MRRLARTMFALAFTCCLQAGSCVVSGSYGSGDLPATFASGGGAATTGGIVPATPGFGQPLVPTVGGFGIFTGGARSGSGFNPLTPLSFQQDSLGLVSGSAGNP